MLPSSSPLNPILDTFGLTVDQRAAAGERLRDVTVTAGAGSGKTRTLVARYLGLLLEGCRPGQVIAITFTEKAAREMRTRVRKDLRRLVLGAQNPAERQEWVELEAQIDSARIGTIHSLCAEILRSHPAEAGLDPQFGVVDESETIRLRAAAVESALLSAVEQPEMRALFAAFSISRLEGLLNLLMIKRLDVSPAALSLAQCEPLVRERILRFLERVEVQTTLNEFRQGQVDGSLELDAGDKLADQLARLLVLFQEAEQSVQQGDAVASAAALWHARREAMGLTTGKKTSLAKEALRELREGYDNLLDPWLGGKAATSLVPDAHIEAQLAVIMPLLQRLYQQALSVYQAALAERQSLDFDGLEAGALALLQIDSVAVRWQAEIAAVLVDEFQDTNARQRQLVLALCGLQPGRLFVVGDARQSIYRFRGADVTVFTSLQQQVQQTGGLRIDLDRTFRAHPGLLEATGSLLSAVMGDQPDPERPFYVPFAPLISERTAPGGALQAPFIECVLGAGEDSDTGRRAAARALAVRLKELRAAGEISKWDQVVLLFRASTGFPFYEEAFEAAGIPFVTVAGSGFYDRPEVRDVLNLLRALADPWDDQALAGFLRSPAIGLSDPAIYLLRYHNGAYRSLRQALEMERDALPVADQPLAERALAILSEFEPWVDRLPVAELLRRLIARTDYRSILAASRSRLWRNVDKLLVDAQSSGVVRVRAFLEYVDTLRDVGAREGEAVAEAAGAVRLMTIHKSKGLEFPVVVLADAARQMVGRTDLAYPLGAGWTVTPDRLPASPLAYRLARSIDAQQAEAENGRLLYVALTRAMEKLIISGHLTVKEDGSWKTNGWLQSLLAAGDADVDGCLAEPELAHTTPLAGGGSWRIGLSSARETAQAEPAGIEIVWPHNDAKPLVAPLLVANEVEESANERRMVRVRTLVMPQVVGGMVHAALQRALLMEDGPALDRLLHLHARQQGLIDEPEIEEALRVAKILLARFRRQPLWRDIQAADERYHALPCHTGQPGAAYIDVLYRSGQSWTLVDFHTGALKGAAAQQAAFEYRLPALLAKRAAVELRLKQLPKALICFLDVDHHIRIQAV